MLTTDEARRVAGEFGVDVAQVARDHLISHVLMALSRLTMQMESRVVFFGGTALARTWLPDGRLSEDIDLIAFDRTEATSVLESPRGLLWELRRQFPDLRWEPALSAVKDVDPAYLRDDSISVKVQLLRAEGGYEKWPVQDYDLQLRYVDCDAATLTAPTLSAFAAMKTNAWFDRREPRDLWDLARLAAVGAIDDEAAKLVRQTLGHGVASHFFEAAPTDVAWRASLAGQTADLGDPDGALVVAREAWSQYF